ncbi:5-guanidino-2-oxopentanoate decarboxylase [Aliiroseovarius subalbicans]|uniref:5-guanidino-2-oxopentanoate decarboxylase n=1 Tax=Aliiroseovarius subalbicans TaxID=2925840 RepID=UPI001F5645FE|nr:5-guanidino-2-oxopentanoate decarboxylase [Aliiroseovarius subalbicans]MCI2399323.1 5-guanidino-2-oxopentanoate decarboxylase [Aliiroseovarius subalbicans]
MAMQQKPTQKPLGAQISHMLKARGVDTIFGIPGVHNIEMYRGIEEAGITHVLARHEQGAGFMADGYARATGRPGVTYVITGPGLLNALTPLGQAWSDSVPVLAISSCLDEVAARKGQLHQMRDQEGAAATVCDWSETATSPEAAFVLVDRAFSEFASERPRPKHMQVPIALLGARADAAPEAAMLPTPPVARAEDVAAAAEWLLGARRPLFIFGGGAIEGSDAARALAAATGAASFCSFAGRGVIAGDDPLHFGAYLSRPGSAELIARADLVIAVGTELAEVDLWRDTLGHDAPLIRVDIDAATLNATAQADLAIQGDAAAFLSDLLALVEPHATPGKWDRDIIASARVRFRAEVDAARPGIAPICDALAAAMPADLMVYSDMTQFAYVAKEIWPMARPGHWHHPFGFGTLGYALPAAIGGKVGRPDLPILTIAGDYGFQYTLQELGVAVELGLPMPILLWDNAKLKEIEDAMVASQIAPNAVVARNPDFVALGKAYGTMAVKPDTVEALIAAVLAGFEADGPTLIHVTPDILG